MLRRYFSQPTEYPCMESAASPPINPLKGIGYMLATMFLFSCINGTAKTLIETMPVVEIVWARYFFQMLLLVLFFRGDWSK